MAGATSYDHDLPVPGESPSIGYDPNYVPDSVKSFVVHMYRHIREKNVYEIHQMYENSFQSISDRLFKDSPWPSVDAVAPYVDNDHVFCLLYRDVSAICMPGFRPRLSRGLTHGIIIVVSSRLEWFLLSNFVDMSLRVCRGEGAALPLVLSVASLPVC
ncbi:UNVERIFIED_CONTAM: Eukaryotic translation initiation factor 3 subunit L [Sesamum latifolium]|uniref:Eukaryotic translation initiation factor 3 subunit L n=1 Tax=Sesamum latifolium TaxID=2727402 RepID=A0AAW2SNT0_9LAMI